jgi:hypothetical protein
MLPRTSDWVLSSNLVWQHATAQSWELDFYAREAPASYVDPAGTFVPAQVGGKLFAVNCVNTIPTPTAPGAYGTI